jgi:hypothetical protein
MHQEVSRLSAGDTLSPVLGAGVAMIAAPPQLRRVVPGMATIPRAAPEVAMGAAVEVERPTGDAVPMVVPPGFLESMPTRSQATVAAVAAAVLWLMVETVLAHGSGSGGEHEAPQFSCCSGRGDRVW